MTTSLEDLSRFGIHLRLRVRLLAELDLYVLFGNHGIIKKSSYNICDSFGVRGIAKRRF